MRLVPVWDNRHYGTPLDSLLFIIAPSLRAPNEVLFAYRLHGFKDDSVRVFEVEGFTASEAVFAKVEFLGR